MTLALAVVAGIGIGLGFDTVRRAATERRSAKANRAAVIAGNGWPTSAAARNIAAIVEVVDGLVGRGPSVRSLHRPEMAGRVTAPEREISLDEPTGSGVGTSA
jgi:hypothetical protein